MNRNNERSNLHAKQGKHVGAGFGAAPVRPILTTHGAENSVAWRPGAGGGKGGRGRKPLGVPRRVSKLFWRDADVHQSPTG